LRLRPFFPPQNLAGAAFEFPLIGSRSSKFVRIRRNRSAFLYAIQGTRSIVLVPCEEPSAWAPPFGFTRGSGGAFFKAVAMQQPIETQRATESLPLFRSEVLCKRERFFGEVLLIRPFSLGFLAWLVTGAVALTYSVLFFGTYTETVPVRGVLLRGQAPNSSQFASPENEASVAVPYLHVTIGPGTQIAIRCLRCPNPAAQFPVIARSVSNLPAPAQKSRSIAAGQMVKLSYQASAASSLKRLLAPGTEVELAIPIGQRRLFELFAPSSFRGKSQP
jgi:hypothetical protein